MKLVTIVGIFLVASTFLQGFHPKNLFAKAWKFDGRCHRKCFGFGCMKKEPTTAEMCRFSNNHHSKCCFKAVTKARTLSENLAEIDSFKEKVKSHFTDSGWYLNDFCQLACRLLACLFQSRPTKQQLCQQQQTKNGPVNCCQEHKKPLLTQTTTHQNNSTPKYPSLITTTTAAKEMVTIPIKSINLEMDTTTTASTTTTSSTTTQGPVAVKRNPFKHLGHRIQKEKKLKTVEELDDIRDDDEVVPHQPTKRDHPPNKFSVAWSNY